VYPLQILLLIPFFHLGDTLFSSRSPLSSVDHVISLFRADLWGAIQSMWEIAFHAVLVWILLAPPLCAILYLALLPLLRKAPFRRGFPNSQSPPPNSQNPARSTQNPEPSSQPPAPSTQNPEPSSQPLAPRTQNPTT
jgi:hypothetical protein